MSYAPGTLVKARGREWVVLPESIADFLVVRPLGGQHDLGDFVSCRLLRDAERFGFRSSADPFRSFGRLAVQQLESITAHLGDLAPKLDTFARARGQQLLESHRRVRSAGARGSTGQPYPTRLDPPPADPRVAHPPRPT
jgi:hypothetical protein